LCLNIVYSFFCSSLALQSLSRVAGHKRSRRRGTNVENPSTRDRRALSASPRACWKQKELESEKERERETHTHTDTQRERERDIVRERDRGIAGKRSKEARRRRRTYIFSLTAVGQEADRVQ
jgi:hypothetical protein